MTDDDVVMLGASRANSLEDAVSRAIADLAAAGRTEPTVYLMPAAAYTVPFLQSEATGRQVAD